MIVDDTLRKKIHDLANVVNAKYKKEFFRCVTIDIDDLDEGEKVTATELHRTMEFGGVDEEYKEVVENFINDAASRVSSEQVSDDGIDTSFCESQTYQEMMDDFASSLVSDCESVRSSTKSERAAELLQTLLILEDQAPHDVLVRLIADAFSREQRIALRNQ